MTTAGEISGARRRFIDEHQAYDRDALDFYIEPRWAVDALLDVEPIQGPAWDPACGTGTIPKTLIARGIACHGTDAADRGYGPVHDFLGLAPVPVGPVATIICNPPYGPAQRFVERALEIATRKVAVLVQAKFVYSQTRYPLFTSGKVARLYHFSDRPSMPPGDKVLADSIRAVGGKMDFLWVVFDHTHWGPAEACWLRRCIDANQPEFHDAFRKGRRSVGR